MSTTEILKEIRRLPLSEKETVFKTLETELQIRDENFADEKELEVDRLLISKGLMREVPSGMTDDEENFEPIKTTGKPLSEIIIEERR
jgi:hypothetical protein